MAARPPTRRRWLLGTVRGAAAWLLGAGAVRAADRGDRGPAAAAPAGAAPSGEADPSAASRGSAQATPPRFYRSENPAYTIVASAADSLRFTRTRCLTTWRGHTCATSSFVDPTGRPMLWHDFGPLEGPGWAANAVGGAVELIRWGRQMDDAEAARLGRSLLDHVLSNGFIDAETGLIRGYRHVPEGRFCLNFKHNDAWLCPGSTAKVALQMLLAADLDPVRRPRLQAAALGWARWMDRRVRRLGNGWFPRRVRPDGSPYDRRAEGGPDPFFATSGDGLFIPWLWAEVTARGLADRRRDLAQALRAFREAGGFYASINHDTYDAHENVAYAVAFRVFRRAAQVLETPDLRAYALGTILPGLEKFKMCEDRNGVATRGLLWMEASWDTAYLWENAEAAQAWLEAYADTGNRRYADDALTVLRTCALHHWGPHGFLTEGVDWNNHVGRQHHIGGAEFGAIRYTEPLLNNQHIVEPTLYYLAHHATVVEDRGRRLWRDHEGNRLWPLPTAAEASDASAGR